MPLTARNLCADTGAKPVSFRRAVFVYWFSLLMFACTYLARSATPAYAVALAALCLGFATFVHFLVLCHPLAHGTSSNASEGPQSGPAQDQAGDTTDFVEEHLFMHACLAANLRTANVLLWSGRVRKEYAAFVIRYLWRLARAETMEEASSFGDCAVAVFELSRAAFPDFISICREDPWAEIMIAWARGSCAKNSHEAPKP